MTSSILRISTAIFFLIRYLYVASTLKLLIASGAFAKRASWFVTLVVIPNETGIEIGWPFLLTGNIFPNVKEKTRLIFGRLMVLVGGVSASGIAILLIPKDTSVPLMQRAITIATIISGGTLGLFCLGFLTRRATRTGVYCGIVTCVLFTSWALLSQPNGDGGRIVDFGFNWNMNSILIGVFGHFVLFGTGYLTSRLFGGYLPDNIHELTIHKVREIHREHKEAAAEAEKN